MKKTNINEGKLRKVIDFLYIKEVLGIGLYSRLSEYPELSGRCDVLRNAAYYFEKDILENKDGYLEQKENIKALIIELDIFCSQFPYYRKSLLYFDENLNYVDSF